MEAALEADSAEDTDVRSGELESFASAKEFAKTPALVAIVMARYTMSVERQKSSFYNTEPDSTAARSAS